MAKRKKKVAQLSEEGLAEFRGRLDRIGRWTVETDEDELCILWKRPVDLADQLALRVEFQVLVAVEGSYDPDERMFELWDSIHRRRVSFLRELRRKMESTVVLEDDEEDENIERSDLEPWEPKLVVRRSGFPKDLLYEVEVVAEAGDDEHVLTVRYDTERGRFDRFWELM